MFSLTVRDRMMIAHSLRGEFFGPAQRLHGATYITELTLRSATLEAHGVVADIGAVARELRSILAELEYRNLDDEPAFAGLPTTTEVLAREIADRFVDLLARGTLGTEVGHLAEVEVLLQESDVARAAYLRDVVEAAGRRSGSLT
jgi:6-pyruvoyl-tetrahydropterin synthase